MLHLTLLMIFLRERLRPRDEATDREDFMPDDLHDFDADRADLRSFLVELLPLDFERLPNFLTLLLRFRVSRFLRVERLLPELLLRQLRDETLPLRELRPLLLLFLLDEWRLFFFFELDKLDLRLAEAGALLLAERI